MKNISPQFGEVILFLEKNNLFKNLEEQYTNWSSEIKVHYSSRVTSFHFEKGNKEFSYQVRPKIIRELSAKQKLFVYEVLRLFSCECLEFRFILDDYRNLLNSVAFTNNARYFYLETLEDWQYLEEINDKLQNAKSRRTYYRKISDLFGSRRLSFENLFNYYFLRPFQELYKPLPKKKHRHKGYRDHGSLGSEWSKTLRDQARDYSIREKEEQHQKEKDDFQDFIRGWFM